MHTESHIKANIDKNREHYNEVYKHVNVDSILNVLNNLNAYLEGASTTEISWVGMYYNNFEKEIKGSTILELGCGDCINAAVMAALGAKVTANDISDKSGDIIKALNSSYDFKYDINYISGDFTQHELPVSHFDYVVGKAFLHHLTLDLEYDILKKVAIVLKPNGIARFFETAVNSKILDELRWAVPMNDRPSKLFQPKAFKLWEAADPHPARDNSTRHYKTVGFELFNDVKIIPLGIFERFNRVIPIKNKRMLVFKRSALKAEKYLPLGIRSFGARSQVIIYKDPKPIKDV